jgi:hypothetical protein
MRRCDEYVLAVRETVECIGDWRIVIRRDNFIDAWFG